MYPKSGKYAVKIYYNHTDTINLDNVIVLYPTEITPEPVALRESKEFISGMRSSAGRIVTEYTMPLEPFEFPADVGEIDEILTAISNNYYFWLETHSEGAYPAALAATPRAISILDAPELEPLPENAERLLTVRFMFNA